MEPVMVREWSALVRARESPVLPVMLTKVRELERSLEVMVPLAILAEVTALSASSLVPTTPDLSWMFREL